jgi:hypothetical protein
MSNPQTIKSPLGEQVLPTMLPGARGPMDNGVKMQQQQTDSQMALIGETKAGGKKRKMRGGEAPVAPQVQVAAVPAGAVNPQATGENYKGLTQLAQQQQTNATFDNAKTPSETAALQSQQQSLYSGKGGSKKRMNKRMTKRMNKKGGSWPKWGCLSGGKQSRKSRKVGGKVGGRVRKSRKSRKTKSRRM